MPRFITDKSTRTIASQRTGIPWSPFQKLIDTARLGKDLSLRTLGSKIGASHNSLHVWLTNANGYPHPKSFKPHHLKALARVLGISEGSIQVALDQSRHIYSPGENPMPPTQVAPLEALISMLEITKGKYVLRLTMLNIAKRIYAGCAAPGRRQSPIAIEPIPQGKRGGDRRSKKFRSRSSK